MPELPSKMFGNNADAYERYMGRWSRLIAPRFLEGLEIAASAQWLDVGCGTGNLSLAILSSCDPAEVHGIDTSPGFIAMANEVVLDNRASFEAFDTETLPAETAAYDAVVSGLVLNFLPDVDLGIAEMFRAVKPGGTVAAYVWDYGGKMEIMRRFWDVAVALDPAASSFDEGKRDPVLCEPNPLRELFESAGLIDVSVKNIDAPAHFEDFDDYWLPFTGNQGSAPRYVASLNAESRNTLREQLRSALPISPERGSIDLIARAWAVSGKRPES
ncbi:MAG: class I SAM-dependent methyltransferase [Dehalococcoidia bacterium]